MFRAPDGSRLTPDHRRVHSPRTAVCNLHPACGMRSLAGILKRNWLRSVLDRGVGLRSLFWAVLLAAHLLAVPSIVDGLAGVRASRELAAPLLRAVWLAASAAFFLLKIADVPWLRFTPGRKSVLSAALAIALFHAVVIERSDADTGGAVPRTGLVVLVGSLPWWFRAARNAVRRFLDGWRSRLTALRKAVDDLRRGEFVARVALQAPVCLLLPHSRALRAPPVSAI